MKKSYEKIKEHPDVMKQQHEQMLRLVAKSFYNELINYGVTPNNVLTVAAYLLDNVMKKSRQPSSQTDNYNLIFTINDIEDGWQQNKCLRIHDVSIVPYDPCMAPLISTWFKSQIISENFYPMFPSSVDDLVSYFSDPLREYFIIYFQKIPVGLIGSEQIDLKSKKLEMKKLIGDPKMFGKGLGKQATFLFLYYVFCIMQYKKVYIHSLDINVRNINLNGNFGFELEGVFFEDVLIQNTYRDVVRMSLSAPVWFELFENT